MKIFLRAMVVFLLVGMLTTPITAQNGNVLKVGDPPNSALIAISLADENGVVTIEGAPGAVFPAAQVAIRNLYTGDVTFTQAGITGSFVVSIYGPGNTPFWISSAQSIPQNLRSVTGTLPGGPGTIIYGAFPESDRTTDLPITQIVLDGGLDDWQAYGVRDGLGLWNTDSIYLALSLLEDYAQIQLSLSVNNSTYNITLDPRRYEAAILTDTASGRDLGTMAVTAAFDELGERAEMRIPLAPIRRALSNAPLNTVQLNEVTFFDVDTNVLDRQEFGGRVLTFVEEQDGIVYIGERIEEVRTRFSVSGAVAQGLSDWHARVRLNQLSYQAGDNLMLEMDVTLNAPDFPASLVGLGMIGRFGLQPVSVGNQVTSSAFHVNNGWSTTMTHSGLAIDNLSSDILLADMVILPQQVVRRGDNFIFGFQLNVPIPEDIPAGVYVPYFEGFARVGDGDIERWSDNGLFGQGEGISAQPLTRMPVVLSVNYDAATEPVQMFWTLFHDYPSDGSRGLVALEDRGRAALSNRVKFNSPTYILPPTEPDSDGYPLEPYIVGMLPNRYDSVSAPLLPLLFPNGRLNVTIQRPDGSVDNLASAPIVQNMLSSAALDEKSRFGEDSPVDVYRITTLNKALMSQSFTEYGEYIIELEGFVEDVWGNRYEGGGTYSFIIAELLDMSPMMLSGTPLQLGDVMNLGLHVSPNVPASVSVRLRVFPLDGGDVIEQRVTGQANAYGVFTPDTPVTMDVPGEYIIDYEARFVDAQDNLWAGSLRTAGVIESESPVTVLRGQRGMPNVDGVDYQPAWYRVEQYTGETESNVQLNTPYHAGDTAWITDGATFALQPQTRLQDLAHVYGAWLQQTHPNYQLPDGMSIERAVVEDALPLAVLGASEQTDYLVGLMPEQIASKSYTYVSYVTPNGAVRQSVVGSPSDELSLLWRMDDPLNEQIGMGAAGMRPGDYGVLFSGAVLNVPQANLREINIYASSLMVIDENDPRGPRVMPPYAGATGGPDSGPLMVFDEQPVSMFFYPTGVRPGNVLTVGDTLAVTGQVVPTLDAPLTISVISPSGTVRQWEGTANAIGYYYDPTFDFAVDEMGLWTVDIDVAAASVSSSGQVEPPVPTGDVLGSDGGRFYVYVVDDATTQLDWSDGNNISISAGFPYNFNFDVPTGWTDVIGYVSVVFPNAIASDGPVNLQGTALRYQFNPTALNQQLPFYEGNNGQLDGASGSDTLTLTFALYGINENGEPDMRARQVTIRHDRLLTID